MAHSQDSNNQGEPVAWAIYDKRGGSKSIHWAEQHTDGNAEMYNAVPLYAGVAPAPAQSAPKGEPTGCACRWDTDDNRVATCARHQGWLDVVHEWAERAKAAEKARGE